jgi:DNA-binding beta-propeller fold protein YncE
VIVFDADTGKYKRHWGAYGKVPDDSESRVPNHDGPAQQYNTVHSVRVSRDGLVYVADRQNRRFQVFTIDGKFIKEVFIADKTLDTRGTVFDFAFSPDKEQRFLYVPDGSNDRVMILNRSTLQVVGSFGHGGPYAGQWFYLHSIAADSKGNLFTGESNGGRVQKFVFKGYSSTASQ